MREECSDSGKYCGLKRHTKALRTEYPDLSKVKYQGWIRCGACSTVFDWKVIAENLLYRTRIKSEYIPEAELSESEVPRKVSQEKRSK